MRDFPTLFLALPLLLAGLATAQDTTTATSALTITTSDPAVARRVLRTFESDAQPPALEAGSVAVLSLDDGGNVTVRTAEGSGWLRIDARPAWLMEMFAAQAGQGRQQVTVMAGFVLGQQGFDFEEIDRMVGAAFALPAQIDALTVTIPTRYEPGEPMGVDVELAPKEGTWLGTLVANLGPHASGVPALPDAGSPMVRLDANFDLPKVLPQLRPILSVLSGMGQETKEQKADAAALMDRFYANTSGTMSMTFDVRNGARMAMGLTDPAKVAELTAEPAYAAMTERAAAAGGMAEAEIDLAAMTHRDVRVMRTRVVFDDPTMAPFGGDGTTESYSAVAGDVMVGTMFTGAKAEVQALIDDVLDQRLKRLQLPDGVLAIAKFDLAAAMDFIAQQGMPAAPEDAPERLAAEIAKTDAGLRLQLKIQ